MFVCLYVSGMLLAGTPGQMAVVQNASVIKKGGEYGEQIIIQPPTRWADDVRIQVGKDMTVEQFLFECEEQAVQKVGIE